MGKIWAADWQKGFRHLERANTLLARHRIDSGELFQPQVLFAGKIDDESELLGILGTTTESPERRWRGDWWMDLLTLPMTRGNRFSAFVFATG